MAQISNEALTQEIEADRDTAVRVSPEEPRLLTQPTALPPLPSIDGKTLHFVSPDRAQTQAARTDKAPTRASVYGDPAAKWFNYALLTLLLLCAASGIAALTTAALR